MSAQRQARALAVARAAGAQVLVASAPETVTWLTGYAARIDTGPNPFALMPICFVDPEQGAVLVVHEGEVRVARQSGCEVLGYPGYRLTGPIEPGARARDVVAGLVGHRRAAVEPDRLPAAVANALDRGRRRRCAARRASS